VHCSALQCVAVRGRLLQCIRVCCSVMQSRSRIRGLSNVCVRERQGKREIATKHAHAKRDCERARERLRSRKMEKEEG